MIGVKSRSVVPCRRGTRGPTEEELIGAILPECSQREFYAHGGGGLRGACGSGLLVSRTSRFSAREKPSPGEEVPTMTPEVKDMKNIRRRVKKNWEEEREKKKQKKRGKKRSLRTKKGGKQKVREREREKGVRLEEVQRVVFENF